MSQTGHKWLVDILSSHLPFSSNFLSIPYYLPTSIYPSSHRTSFLPLPLSSSLSSLPSFSPPFSLPPYSPSCSLPLPSLLPPSSLPSPSLLSPFSLPPLSSTYLCSIDLFHPFICNQGWVSSERKPCCHYMILIQLQHTEWVCGMCVCVHGGGVCGWVCGVCVVCMVMCECVVV